MKADTGYIAISHQSLEQIPIFIYLLVEKKRG